MSKIVYIKKDEFVLNFQIHSLTLRRFWSYKTPKSHYDDLKTRLEFIIVYKTKFKLSFYIRSRYILNWKIDEEVRSLFYYRFDQHQLKKLTFYFIVLK